MAKRLARVKIGEFYAIPLFLSEYIETQRFKKADLEGDDKLFAFCRIIDDSGVSIIIEVFKLVSKLPVTFENILNSGRLYDPIMINGLGIYKKDGNYSESKRVMIKKLIQVFPISNLFILLYLVVHLD